MASSPCRYLAFLGFLFSVGCGSDDSNGADKSLACVPGQSDSCAGPSGCSGAQVCAADGASYDECVCGMATGGATNRSSTVRPSATGGKSSTTIESSMGGTGQTDSSDPVSTGGSTPSTGGTVATGTQSNATCAPKNMGSQTYPSYAQARAMAGACTETEIQNYYANCYSAGNCTAFKTGGASAKCGACLVPSDLDAESFGPLLKLGSTSAYVTSTNLAGCIELQGEGDCAKKIQIAQLCEYLACAESCPLNDSASYQAQISCMMNARSTVCSAAQTAATCIKDSAHIAACSASDMKGQFVNIARVMCL